MPILRPFRALRFDVPDSELSALLCPPYDVIDPAQRRDLLDRDPRNAVRIELPADLGTAGVDDYRAAARTVAEWRSGGVLRKDREPTITLHRMRWMTDRGEEAQATGVLARLRLEPLGPGSGVLPHERTHDGPKEDRYALLKATGLNTSPIVLLADRVPDTPAVASGGTIIERISALTSRPPDALAKIDGVDHEVWVVPTTDLGRDTDGERVDVASSDLLPGTDEGAALLAGLAAGPLTIADGHHRYETALRYREERARNRACESDPAWDYVMALVYPPGGSPPALPTHRVVSDAPTGDELLEALGPLAAIERLSGTDELIERMAEPPPMAPGASGSGRIGMSGGGRSALLRPRPGAIRWPEQGGPGPASRDLDVVTLAAILEAVWGRDGGSLADEGHLRYVRDLREAVGIVERGEAASCFLLDPVPASAITRVARSGEVMPQKSTYFHPKAPTGLLFSPMEW